MATNIAETSLPIQGIVYVVDSGFVKQIEFDAVKRLTTLKQVEISQAEAIQRKNRAGRTREGKCYRLYSEDTFNRMKSSPVPEIQRSNLEHTILLLATHGTEDVYNFDFIDRPPPTAIAASLVELEDLGAFDSFGQLTQLGRQMSQFPVDPKSAKVLIMSKQLDCSEEILTIISILAARSTAGEVFIRDKKTCLPNCFKMAFMKINRGDHLTLLEVFNQWKRNGCSSDWCRQFCVNDQALQEASLIRNELQSELENNTPNFPNVPPSPWNQAIQRCILSGYFSQIARKISRRGYVTYANPNELVYIDHTCGVYTLPLHYNVIFDELI